MTLVCGIKLTHDGGLAVIDSPAAGPPRLLASIEAEKLANATRHAEWPGPGRHWHVRHRRLGTRGRSRGPAGQRQPRRAIRADRPVPAER